MRWIVRASLRFRWLVVFAAAACWRSASPQIPSAKVDVFPEFAPPRVEIQTIALGQLLERGRGADHRADREAAQRHGGPDELRSKSVAQLSSIELIFERGTDELRARQLVAERVARSPPTLPTWASPAVHDARRCRRPAGS